MLAAPDRFQVGAGGLSAATVSNRDPTRDSSTMTRHSFLVGLSAGFLAALVFVSATTGPLVARFVLFLLTPLPLFIAGLGWGWMATAVAALTGTGLVLFVGASPGPATVFAASQALPAMLLVYLTTLHRQTPEGTEWYPIGRIVVVAALCAGALASLWLIVLGGDVQTLKAGLKSLIESALKNDLPQMPGGKTLSGTDIDAATDVAMTLFPAASALSSLGGLLFGLWLAGRILHAAGHLIRPWPDLAATVYPSLTPLLLAGSTAATFLDGAPGLVAAGFAGAFFLAYVLLGLAIAHYVTRGYSWRPFALWVMYGILLLMNAGVSLVLALIGLAESIIPLRRFPPPPGPGDGGAST